MVEAAVVVEVAAVASADVVEVEEEQEAAEEGVKGLVARRAGMVAAASAAPSR